MSEREIRGTTICFGEHLDTDGYSRCSKCNSKTILVATSGQWDVDAEPFKDGEETSKDTPEEVFVGEVSGHYCPKCEMLVSLSYNFS